MTRNEKRYTNFPNVEAQKNELFPEEFPEGAFGSVINQQEKVTGKSTHWQEGQQRLSAFVYSDKEIHDDLPRQADGAHPLHDE